MLPGKHTSIPHNPDVANTFFRAWQTKSWGRGIERIRPIRHQAGTLELCWTVDTTEVWVEFGLLEASPETMEVTTQVTMEVVLLRALTTPLTRQNCNRP